MAINDYLQGIQNATSGEKQDVQTATTDLTNMQVGGGSLVTKLKEALNNKLNNNRDIINQQADTMGNYFNSGAQAREKYQDVWNPFEKAKLVQQERSMALRPYDVLSGVLENRMGDVNDIVQSGIQGWQGMADAATTKLGVAQNSLATALQAYLAATGQQEAADQLGLQIAQAKEQSRQFNASQAEQARQFGITSGMTQQQIDNQVDQFNKELALKIKNSGSGGLSQSDKSKLTADIWTDMMTATGGDLSKIWHTLHQNEKIWSEAGVNVQSLWNQYTSMGGSSTAPSGKPKATGILSNLFGGNNQYANTQLDLTTGKIPGNPVPVPASTVKKPGDLGYVDFSKLNYLQGYGL